MKLKEALDTVITQANRSIEGQSEMISSVIWTRKAVESVQNFIRSHGIAIDQYDKENEKSEF